MPGPVAKHPDARRRANRRATAAELAADGQVHGPALGDGYVLVMTAGGPLTRPFGKKTKAWWSSLRRSPHAGAYQEVHWQWLAMLAPLFDRWVELGDLDALKELRLQAPPFGLRPADANRLDWTIDPQVVGPAARDEQPQAHEPPRSGKGSSRAAWARYASEVFSLDASEMSRQQIFDAVDAARVAVEGRPSRVDPRLIVHDGGAATAS